MCQSSSNVRISDDHVDTVTGYSDGFYRVKAETGLSHESLVDQLLDHSVEQCPNCKWFTDSFNLLPEGGDSPDGYCDNCRSYDKRKD